jgi:hypothetical protein
METANAIETASCTLQVFYEIGIPRVFRFHGGAAAA